MGIINSIGEINKNSSNFKQWEIEQENIDAKREELNKRKPPTQEELKKAKKLGETIMDVVDVMDQHSEDIAENVETATIGPLSSIPILATLLSFFGIGKFIINPQSNKISEIQKKFVKDNEEKIKKLVENFRKESPLNKGLKDVQILNKHVLKTIKASEPLKKEAEVLIKELSQAIKNPAFKIKISLLIPLLTGIGSFVAGNVFATKLQVGSSKIARFQARKVLEDPKYFVSYTPEQIEEAKNNLKANKNKKSKKKNKLKVDKLKNGMFRGIASIIRDNKAYSKWRKSDDAKPEKIDRHLTQEELENAQKDKEIIQRVVKKINNKAEVYSENMEVAANVLLNGTPVLGGAVGWVVSAILTATKILPNMVKKMVSKYGDEKAQEAYKKMIGLPKDVSLTRKINHLGKFTKNLMSSNVNNQITLSKWGKIGEMFKKISTVALSTKIGRNLSFEFIGGFITGLAGMVLGLKLQKASARAGRYVAKRELEKNPQNFIGYSDKELSEVQNVSAKQKTNKLKEYLLFLPNVIKQYFEYQKYKKTTLKQEKVLKEELTKLEVTDKQLKDAKNLQRKIFNTFEQVDDKSQEYSESVEAACEIAQPFAMLGGILTMISPLIVFGVQAARGKVSVKSVVSKIVSFLGGSSKIINKKFFKNYLNNAAKKIPTIVQNAETEEKIFKQLLKDINLNKLFAKGNELNFGDFSKALTKNIDNLNEKEFNLIIQKLKEFPFLKGNKIFEEILKTTKKDQAVMLLEILNKNFGNQKLPTIDVNKKLGNFIEKIGKMSDTEVKEMTAKMAKKVYNFKLLRSLDIASMDKAYFEKILPKVQKMLNNLPQKEVKNIIEIAIEEFNKNPDEFIKAAKNGSIAKILMTKGLKTALKAAGVSWVALNIAMIFVIESWLADMQLKGGRLGVMKALEALKDPEYYANSEPDDNKNKK